MNAEEYLNDELDGAHQSYDETGIVLINGIEHSEICRIMDEYAEAYHQEKMQNDLSDAYHGGWRRSKKYAKETNFHGLNRGQIKEYFQKWYNSHYNNKLA